MCQGNTQIRLTEKAIEQAAGYLLAGGCIVFPTDTVYGIGCLPSSHDALKRIYDLKSRPREVPLQILLSDCSLVGELAFEVPACAEKLMEAFWPGAMTLLLPARPGLPEELVGPQGTVGLRVPDLAELQQLTSKVGGTLASTSANRSGQATPRDPEHLSASIRKGVDYLLDAGILPESSPSTVVDCSGPTPCVVRRGTLDADRLRDCGIKL